MKGDGCCEVTEVECTLICPLDKCSDDFQSRADMAKKFFEKTYGKEELFEELL